MSSEPRRCPFCNAVMTPGQRMCPNPDCGNPYPFDDEQATQPRRPAGVVAAGARGRAGVAPAARAACRSGGALAALAPHRTILVLVGVLVLIVLVGFLLFRFGHVVLRGRSPGPVDACRRPRPAPVVVPPTARAPGGSPVAGPSPSPGAGTVISPAALRRRRPRPASA